MSWFFGLGDALMSGCDMVAKGFDGMSNKLDEWIEQDEESREVRDLVAFEASKADAARQLEKLNKQLAKTGITEDQLMQRVAAFAAAKKQIKTK